jgi:hypothetical protein
LFGCGLIEKRDNKLMQIISKKAVRPTNKANDGEEKEKHNCNMHNYALI